MILRRIVEFAERQDSTLPAGYQPRFVTKEIDLQLDGKLRNVIPLSGETRGKRIGRTRHEPQESPMRTVAVKPRLFADNVNYVLGKAREKDSPAKVAERHQAWRELIDQVAQELPEVPEVLAVKMWLAAGGAEALVDDPRFGEDDEVTFSVNGRYVTDIPDVRQFWANRGAEGRRAVCLISGKTAPVAERMPAPIKGVPDGQMSGTALISVNNPAGESYGLVAALNSPIAEDAAEKLCNGLNVLLNEEAGTDSTGRRKFKYSLRVGKAVYLAWCRNEVARNPLGDMDDPDPEHVKRYIELARKGGAVATPHGADFFVLSLSANAARIVVRDYHETTLTNVQANLGRWFERLEIVGADGQPARPVGVYRLAASLYRDANKEMPAHVPTALLAAALAGRRIPDYILGLAVKRNLAMQGPFYEAGFGPAKTRMLSLPRLALIKAALAKNPQDNIMNHQIDHRDKQAFACGRLLAVLDSIYTHFLNVDTPKGVKWKRPKVNVSTRYYGAACASPASVFGRLIDNSRPHLSKLRAAERDYGYELKIEEIAGLIGEGFPKTLDVRRQGVFALGYYHQAASDRAARSQFGIKEDDSTIEDNAE